MTDDELRDAIGKAKGCAFEYVRKSTYGVEAIKYNRPKFQERWIKSGEAFLWPMIGKTFLSPAPNWPTNIKAVWELVEEMGCGVNIRHEINGYGDKWHCSFDVPTWYSDDTAPRAICLAYLAWKETR